MPNCRPAPSSIGRPTCAATRSHADLPPQPRERQQPGGRAAAADQPNNTINANPATTRWSSPTTPTTCSASPRSLRRWTRPAPATSSWCRCKRGGQPTSPLVQKLWTASAAPGRAAPGGWRPTVLVDPRKRPDPARAEPAAWPPCARWSRSLTSPASTPATSIRRGLHLKNADAVKLATVLRAAFAHAGAGGGTSGSYARRPIRSRSNRQHHAERRADRRPYVRRRHHHPVARAPALHRRLCPGRPVHQLADHHGRPSRCTARCARSSTSSTHAAPRSTSSP